MPSISARIIQPLRRMERERILRLPAIAESPSRDGCVARAETLTSTFPRSSMSSDHTRDIEMARRAGLRSILVKTGHADLDGEWIIKPDHVVDDLTGAAALIEDPVHRVHSALR
jgi:HAD-hyrolase-like